MTDLEAPSFSLGLDSDLFDSDSEPPFTSFKDNNDGFETLVVQDSDPDYPDPHPNLHRLRRGPTVSATSSSSPSHVLHSTAVRHTDEHLHTQHNVGCTSSNEREAVTASCCNAVFPKLAAGPVREFSLTDSDSDCYDPVVGRKCKRKQNVSNAWGDSPKAYRYFFHDDIRIQELVQSRLPNFFPLGNMLNIDLERSGTSEIDYMGQFRFGKSSKQAAGTIKEKNSSNGRKNSRKLDTDEMSQGWVNPKLGVEKVRAKGAVKRKVHTARQSAGHWLTGSDGKKVPVSTVVDHPRPPSISRDRRRSPETAVDLHPPSIIICPCFFNLRLTNRMSVLSSSSSSSDEDAEDLNDMTIFAYLKKHTKLFMDRLPCRTSILSGKEYTREILCGNPIQCYELFRMKPHVFLNLCDKLKLLGLLQDSRDVSVEEALGITLRILGHGTTQRVISDRYQHSTSTVHYWFKTVLRALKAFALTVVKPVDRGAVQPEILANSRWYPFFKNCIGAIDGTHVAAWAPASKQKSFRGRKAVLVTQNVMAVCSHDMMFTFVYTGWEGTANDSRVFYDAITRPENKFPMPSGDYFYVVDSGYPNLKGFLAPYRGERYHRSDWQSDQHVRGKKEMFNFVHSSVRNVIERSFGVLKARFHILKDIPNYPLRRQMLIPHACCALHNYIRMEDRADKLFAEYGQDYLEVPGESSNVVQEGFPIDMTDNSEILQVRASITDALWDKYSSSRRSRTQR